MSVSHDLTNLRVLITRPIKQASALATRLQAAGAIALVYPVLRIEPTLSKPIPQLHAVIHDADWVIFTSSNAIWHSSDALQQLWQQPFHTPQLIAIGPATAQTLREQGFPQPLTPQIASSSEGLLAEPFMQDCANKKIVIISGVGGRSLLSKQLRARGGLVKKIAVYRRCPGIKPSKYVITTWQTPGVDVVISTSGESLTQLVQWVRSVGKPYHAWLLQQSLLLISQRLVPIAKKLGFTCSPLIAATASDTGIVQTLQQAKQIKEQHHV